MTSHSIRSHRLLLELLEEDGAVCLRGRQHYATSNVLSSPRSTFVLPISCPFPATAESFLIDVSHCLLESRPGMQQVLLLLCFLAGALSDPVVEGDLGKISGKVLRVLDVEVEAFLGIPYAKPPVGDLRFALPEAFGNVGDFDANGYGPSCPQLNPRPIPGREEVINEDCLHLNVFRKQGTSSSDKKAVSSSPGIDFRSFTRGDLLHISNQNQ